MAYFDPVTKTKVDYLSNQLDAWKAMFRVSEDLFQTFENLGCRDNIFSKAIEGIRQDCEQERLSLYTRYDEAALSISAGSKVESTSPITCNIPFADSEKFRNFRSHLSWSSCDGLIGCDNPIARPASSANVNRAFGSLPEAFDRSHSALGSLSLHKDSDNVDNSMNYAAAAKKKNVAPTPEAATYSQQMSMMDFYHRKLQEAVQKPDHYNLLENSTTTRYFLLRPSSPVDILASLYHSSWSASSSQVNQRLGEAFNTARMNQSVVYLFFSLQGTEDFSGVAVMTSPLRELPDDSWLPSHGQHRGRRSGFTVEWLYVKDLTFGRFKIRDQAYTPQGQPALIKEALDGTEIASTIENRMIGKRLVHSYHDLCSMGASVLTDKARFRTLWPKLCKVLCQVQDSDRIDEASSESDHEESVAGGLDYVEPSMEHSNDRYFICRPATSQDVTASIERSLWAAGSVGGHGRVHKAFANLKSRLYAGHVYLFFSVWGSDSFCGMAEMTSPVNFNHSPTWMPSFKDRFVQTLCHFLTPYAYFSRADVVGEFHVKWLHVAKVPFATFSGRCFSLSSTKGKPCELPLSRDCDELLTVDDGKCLMNAFFDLKKPPQTMPPKQTLTIQTSVAWDRNVASESEKAKVQQPGKLSKLEQPTAEHRSAPKQVMKARTIKSVLVDRSAFVCGVCRSRGPAKAISLSCGHAYHEGCYLEWAKRNSPEQCPVCRQLEKGPRKPLSLFGCRF